MAFLPKLCGKFEFLFKIGRGICIFTTGILILALLSEVHKQPKMPGWLLVHWQWQEKNVSLFNCHLLWPINTYNLLFQYSLY